MADRSHLDALNRRLANEKDRLAMARTDKEREIRSVWVAQIEKEIADEIASLNRKMRETRDDERFLREIASDVDNMSDDDLIAALMA